MSVRALAFVFALASASVLAQQTPPNAKTTEQQARSYVLSAFMTGAAPLILSEDVAVTPELRQRLNVAPEDGSRAIYRELMRITGGKRLSVRPAIRDEVMKAQAHPEPGRPLFAVEAGNETLVVQYDLERDVISFVGQPSAAPVAVSMPVKESPPAEKISQATPQPAAEPKPVESRPLTPEPTSPAAPVPLQVVEPQVPRTAQPSSPPPAAQPPAAQPPQPAMKRTGPCVIKPVMSDQDLVNCGATPR